MIATVQKENFKEEKMKFTKGIILGTIMGIIIGVFINDIILAFSICTTLGLTLSIVWVIYKKFKSKKGTK